MDPRTEAIVVPGLIYYRRELLRADLLRANDW
jgi:hypothetical protein